MDVEVKQAEELPVCKEGLPQSEEPTNIPREKASEKPRGLHWAVSSLDNFSVCG